MDAVPEQDRQSRTDAQATRSGSDIVLSGRGLSKVYTMGEVSVHALREVDIDLHAGELLVLLGASGSGKSTLLNILGGLDVPSSGRLEYCGLELSNMDGDELTNIVESIKLQFNHFDGEPHGE
jgi:putative ABC transport system ATP-binding protein